MFSIELGDNLDLSDSSVDSSSFKTIDHDDITEE